ncbi:FAD-dependent thymidylate synthase [Kitasatospora sp. NPDC058218]|uniref:FAD-dependent thymidylate synthase n=1 Tax=Kitasatospora sp. NPDC058218 TaxID=3346385 RepID=UPI0036DA7E78
MELRSDMQASLIKHAAEDGDVTCAARVSTLGGEARYETSDDGAGLINYLMRDRHGSPFEHTSFTFYVEAPIFVAREFMRHRAGWSYNEESGRYKELQPVFYVPDDHRKLVQVGKPGRYEFEDGTELQRTALSRDLYSAYSWASEHYRSLLSRGIAREVARIVLPVGLYTSFYATCNARSLMHFLSLRTKNSSAKVPSFPQREIEMVAESMEEQFKKLMPVTYAAFNTHGRIAP